MKRTNVFAFVFILLALALLPQDATADKRKYIWTYEYQTMPRGEAELEHYLTFSTPDIGLFTGNTSVNQQVELEFGMTDRLDFGVYQVFSQDPGGDLKYKGFKLRTRYRFGEKGLYPIDPLIYFEYKNKPDFSESEFEFKLILAKDIGRINIAFNPTFEIKDEEELEFEAKYAIGISYEINDLLSLGVEAKGGGSGHYLGPVLSHGSERFWVSVGTAFSLGEVDPGKPEFELRSIIGVQF